MASSGFTPMATFPSPSPFYGFPSASPYAATFPTPASGSSQNWPTHPTTPVADPPPFPCFWSAPYAYPYTAACPAPAYDPSSFGPAAASSPAAQPAPNQEHFRPSWCSPSHPIQLTPTAPNQEHQPPHPPITIPTPGYYYSTFPYDSSCQMREASQIPTHVDPNWSPATPTLVHGDHNHHSSPECHAAARVGSSAAPLLELPNVHPVLPMVGFPYVPPNPAPPESTSAPVRPVIALPHRPDQAPGAPLPTDLSRPTPQLLDTIQTAPDRMYQPLGSRPTHLKEFALQLKVAHRSLLDISRQLDEYQAQSKRSFASLQSGISRLVDMVSSSKSSTARTQSVGFKPSSASITLAESTTPVLSNIGAAEISPASSSSASFGGSFDVPKPASALTVPTAPAAPQVLDEMPQCYSLHNLNRHSLFRADGIEHKYFTLPADYPLERDVRKPVLAISDDESDGCSIESVQVFAVSTKSVHVFTDTEQQTYEEEKRESFQSLKCFSKTTFSVKKPTDTVGIFSLKNDARACNGSVLKTSNSVATRSSQLSIEHRKKESRLLWDPGASAFLMTPLDDGSNNDPIGNEHVGHLVSSLGELSFHNIPPAKPPESEEFPAMQAIQSTCFLLEAIQSWQRGAFSLGNFARSALWCNLALAGDKIFEDQHSLDSSMKKGTIFSSGRMLPWNPRYILLLHYFLWEFSMDKVSSKTAVPTLMDLRHFWAQFWSQSHSWYNTSADFLQVHYCCLAIVLDCPHSETVLQFACYSCMFSWTEAILSAICMSTATSVCAIVVLCSGKISQEGRDAAVLYKVLKIQLPTSNTSHIWDPGIESLHFSCNRLNITELIQIKGWISMAYSGISLSQYPYILIFFHGQLEFVRPQGVHETDSTKHLLPSSHIYQYREMDIIFITFLPP